MDDKSNLKNVLKELYEEHKKNNADYILLEDNREILKNLCFANTPINKIFSKLKAHGFKGDQNKLKNWLESENLRISKKRVRKIKEYNSEIPFKTNLEIVIEHKDEISAAISKGVKSILLFRMVRQKGFTGNRQTFNKFLQELGIRQIQRREKANKI